MRGKPLYPFALTALLGIGLIIVLSFVGLNQGQDMAGEDGDNGEEQEFETTYELGEDVYIGTCAGCHGGDLEGVGSNPALSALEGKYSAEEIVNIIAEGPGAMPGGLATPAESEAIAEYLLTESE